MITCKSVSNALARGDYDKLPPLRKKMLKLHIKMCAMCGPYNDLDLRPPSFSPCWAYW